MGDNFGSRRGKRSSIEVEISKKGGMGGEGRMNTRRPKKIEGQGCLWKEAIPFRQRKKGVNSAEGGNKMIFEGANGTFGGVDTVLLRGNTLENDSVLAEGVFERLRAFIVQNVEFGGMTLLN